MWILSSQLCRRVTLVTACAAMLGASSALAQPAADEEEPDAPAAASAAPAETVTLPAETVTLPTATADSPADPAAAPRRGKSDPRAAHLYAETEAPSPELSKPRFAIGVAGYYVKPIIAVAGGPTFHRLVQQPNPDAESRATTIAVTRFGLEGRLGRYVTFRSEFERNLGLHGSGVWEGTAEFSVRDQWLRVENWGARIEGGVILDDASVDYYSMHVSDTLLADKYARDPLLWSGFNRGQGVQASYSRWGLRANFNFTAGNPLSTSSSYQVGGTFAGNARLVDVPKANFRAGQPDDTYQFMVLSPSLSFMHPLVEAHVAGQFFTINYNTASREDPSLTGSNLRFGVKLKLRGRLGIPFTLTPFFNVNRERNDVLNNTAGYADSLLMTRFQMLGLGAGADLFILGRAGIGFEFARFTDRSPSFVPPTAETAAHDIVTEGRRTYINVGLTYWLTNDVAAGARYARYSHYLQHPVDAPDPTEIDDTFFCTLRLYL